MVANADIFDLHSILDEKSVAVDCSYSRSAKWCMVQVISWFKVYDKIQKRFLEEISSLFDESIVSKSPTIVCMCVLSSHV